VFLGCVTKYLSNVLYFSGQSAGQSLGGSLKDSFVDDSSAIAELKADSPVEDDSIFDSPRCEHAAIHTKIQRVTIIHKYFFDIAILP